MEPFGWLIISYYGNRHTKGLYNIHALFHWKPVTAESKQLRSEGTFSVNQWSDAIPHFPRKPVTIKTRLCLFYLFNDSLKRVYIEDCDVDDNDYFMMMVRETFCAIRLLTSESSSNQDHPWIIKYFYGIFNT